MKYDLSRKENEKERIERQLSNRETEIQKLMVENENCFGKEKNSLMVLSGYESQSEYLSYLLKPDGSKSSRTIKMPSSSHEDHYLYGSISALIRGKVYIFGGDGGHKFRVRL